MPPRKAVSNPAKQHSASSPPKEIQQKPKTSLDKHPYLSELFLEYSGDTTKYICLLCTENVSELTNLSGHKSPSEAAKVKSLLQENVQNKNLVLLSKYWVRKHLMTKIHSGFTKPEDKPKLQEAIHAIGFGEKDQEGLPQNAIDLHDQDLNNPNDPVSEILPLSENMETKLYIELCYFIIQNHLPYDSSTSLLNFIKHIMTKYHEELLDRSHIGATTTKRIISECISKSIRTKLVASLRDNPYSLLIDASSDIFGGKYLAVFVRYADFEEQTLMTRLLKVIELTTDQSGETLLKLLNDEVFMNDKKIRENLVGISTDNGSNMISSLDCAVNPNGAGLVNRLTKETENLIFVRDLCHCINLVAENAIRGLPAFIEQFIRKVCSYMNSGQRNLKFKQFQREKGSTNPLEISSYTETRWESLLSSTERILQVWDQLKDFLSASDSPLKEDMNSESHLYAYLLYILLHRVVGYIIYYQKPNLLINQVLDKMQEAYTLFTRMIVKDTYQDISFEEAFEINLDEPQNVLHKAKIATREEFGQAFLNRYSRIQVLVSEVLATNPRRKNIKAEAFDHARAFIINALITMRKKLPFTDIMLQKSLIIYFKEVKSIEVWRSFFADFSNIIKPENEVAFQEEIDIFSLHYKKIVETHNVSDLSVIRRWKSLKSSYPLLFKIASALLAIPYSTSQVESVFSEFKSYKTAPRNRISCENLEASLIVEQFFRDEDFAVTMDMIERYAGLWETKKKEEAKNGSQEEEKSAQHFSEVTPSTQSRNELVSSNLQPSPDLQTAMTFINSFQTMIQSLSALPSSLTSQHVLDQQPASSLQQQFQAFLAQQKGNDVKNQVISETQTLQSPSSALSSLTSQMSPCQLTAPSQKKILEPLSQSKGNDDKHQGVSTTQTPQGPSSALILRSKDKEGSKSKRKAESNWWRPDLKRVNITQENEEN